MKTLISALVALSVLAGIAAPASAFDAKNSGTSIRRAPSANCESMRGRVPTRMAKAPPLLPAGLFLFRNGATGSDPGNRSMRSPRS